MNQDKLDPTILQQARDAQKASEDALAILGQHALDRAGISKGGIVRDRTTGNLYRVDGVMVGRLNTDDIPVTLLARRTYKTGRADSRHVSTMDLTEVKSYSPDED